MEKKGVLFKTQDERAEKSENKYQMASSLCSRSFGDHTEQWHYRLNERGGTSDGVSLSSYRTKRGSSSDRNQGGSRSEEQGSDPLSKGERGKGEEGDKKSDIPRGEKPKTHRNVRDSPKRTDDFALSCNTTHSFSSPPLKKPESPALKRKKVKSATSMKKVAKGDLSRSDFAQATGTASLAHISSLTRGTVIKIVNNDRCAHTLAKTMKVEPQTRVDDICERFVKMNTLLDKPEDYGLYYNRTLLSGETQVSSLNLTTQENFYFILKPDAPLHSAVSAQSVDLMERLTAPNMDLHAVDGQTRNLLHVYALSKTTTPDEEVLKFLKKHKLSFTSIDKNGKIPLFYAIETQKVKMIQYLLRNVSDCFSFVDSQHRTPVHALCQVEGLKEEPQYQLVSEAVKYASCHSQDTLGNYPIHYATKNGKLRIVNFLIDECGIDPDLRNGQLETPLYLAVLHKRIAVAAYLSKAEKASRFITGVDGRFPLDIAIEHNSPELVEMTNFKEMTLTLGAILATRGDSVDEIVKEMTTSPPKPRRKTPESPKRSPRPQISPRNPVPVSKSGGMNISAPMMVASSAIRIERTKRVDESTFLKKEDSAPVAKRSISPPPSPGRILTRQKQHHGLDVYSNEIVQKHDINWQQNLTQCLFFCALRGKIPLFLEFMRRYPRDIITNYKVGDWNLLAALIHNCSPETDYMNLLNDFILKSDLQTRVSRNRTLLHFAILMRNEFAMQLLLARGCSINMFDEIGFTELHIAVMTGNSRTVRDLIALGCDPMMRALNQETSLDLAERLKKKDLVLIFKHHLGVVLDPHECLEVSLPTQPNFVRVHVSQLSLIAPDDDHKWRIYVRMSHKLVGKQKIFKTEEIKKVKGRVQRRQEIVANYRGCEEELQKYFKSRGHTDLGTALLEMSQNGNLAMVRFLVEIKDVSFFLVKGKGKIHREDVCSSGGVYEFPIFGIKDTPKSVAKNPEVLQFLEDLEMRDMKKSIEQNANSTFGSMQNLLFCPTQKPLPARPDFDISYNASSSNFVIKKGNVIYRELEIRVLSGDPNLPEEVHELLGRANILLDFAVAREKQYTLTLTTPLGVTGEIDVFLIFSQLDQDALTKYEEDYIPYDPFDSIRKIKRVAGHKKIGIARRVLGGEPAFPIMIVPGLASSALEAFATDDKEWFRERVWIDPFKIGRLAVMEKINKKFQRKKKKVETDLQKEELDDEEEVKWGKMLGQSDRAEKKRKWIAHMILQEDGISDPPGIKVRPVQGLHGIDFLAESSVAKAQSYVFSHVIRSLIDFGYDYSMLDACPYDWRLPPSYLQKRDNFFRVVKKKIEAMVEQFDQKVVLLAHSMGNRVTQYFLKWVELDDKEWAEKYVQAFLALGAPFLGSAKALRTVICGDSMGLEVFLTEEEALYMATRSASLPFLFPVHESAYPDDIIRVTSKSSFSELPFVSEKFETVLSTYVPRSLHFYQEFYCKDPLYLFQDKETTVGSILPPVLDPPPCQNIWVINGINRDTEVGYYMKNNKPILDPSADKYSHKKLAGINPRGLPIKGGIAYESSDTFQPSVKIQKSGDGTVPYCSLNYAETGWSTQRHVFTVEIEDVEHREMLANDAVLNEIINFISRPIRSKPQEEK